MRSPTWNDARKTFLITQVVGSTGYWTLNDLEYAFEHTLAVNVFDGYNLSSWGVSSLVTSRTATSFTCSGNGGVYSAGELTPGATYSLSAEVTTTAPGGLSIRDAATASAESPQIGNAPATAGTHTISGTYTATATGIYIRQVGAGTTTVTSLVAFEVL